MEPIIKAQQRPDSSVFWGDVMMCVCVCECYNVSFV